MKCEQRGKLEFIKDVFTVCEKTQTFIFVNTKDFANKVNQMLIKGGYASYILFGNMANDERDEIMQKFRDEKINVLICTDLLSRGIDIPEAQLVINFDVPTSFDKKLERSVANPETYIHRIGRGGRFGTSAVAVTLWNRDQDKDALDEIAKHYKIEDKIEELQGADHLRQLINDMIAEETA